MPPPSDANAAFVSDDPGTTREDDRFNRWPFAERIAHVLRDRREASSLVVGIYGSWGEGKTTVLNFIEEALSGGEGVEVVRFNPWRFGDEDALIQQFFLALASAVGRPLKTRSDLARKAFDALTSILSASVSGVVPGLSALGDAFGLEIDPSSFVAPRGEPSLDTLRKRLSEALREAGVRVVVRIDDIDRLDKDEVQAVFRLVKLSADFEHVAYVLALDPDMVAASLQERFGPGQERAGYDFLEKVVTVPLALPPARPQALYEIVVGAVNEALHLAGVGVEDGGSRFASVFWEGVLPAVRTPRMAKRYGNAARFALPILAGEVNPTDQLLVEAMRLVYPELYAHVRSNEALYLRTPSRDLFGVSTADPVGEFERRQAEMDELAERLAPDAPSAAATLIDALFPAAREVNEPDARELREAKRVASEWYFERYFSYAVPEDSVADRDLANLVTLAEGGDADAVTERLRELATPKRTRGLAWALAFHSSSISSAAACPLAVAIARLSDRFHAAAGAEEWKPPQWRAMTSAAVMLRSIPRGPEREAAAEAVVQACPRVEDGMSALRAFRPGSAAETGPLLDEAGLARMESVVAERVAAEVAERAPHLDPGANAASRYGMWARHRSRKEVADYIRQRLVSTPDEAVALLRAQVPMPREVNEPTSYPAKYDRSAYDAASAYLDPADLASALREVYGDEVLDAGWVNMDHVRMGLDGQEIVSEDEGLARQFMAMHRAALSQEARPGDSG